MVPTFAVVSGLAGTISISTVVILALVAFIVAKFAFKKDEQIEDRRKKAIDLSVLLGKVGFVDLPLLLRCYAVGDYSGAFDEVEVLWRKYSDPVTSKAAVGAMLVHLLDTALTDPEAAKKVVEKVQAYIDAQAAADAKKLAELKAKAEVDAKLKAAA